MSTVLTNGIIIPDNGSRNWGGDLANNWNILDVNVGYMTDVKNKVTTLENSVTTLETSVTTLETSVAENTANIQINTSNISALQTSKQDVIADLETIRTGASAGATAVQPSALNNYLPLTGGSITGNLVVNDSSDGWKPCFEWNYNNERYAYIHAFTDEARGEKSLFIQADTHVSLASQNLVFSVSRIDNDNTYQNALNFQCNTNGTFNFYSNIPVNLGTSTNKWKTINGLNPGALSLPDCGEHVDVTSQVVSSNDVFHYTNNLYDALLVVTAFADLFAMNNQSFECRAVKSTDDAVTINIPLRLNETAYMRFANFTKFAYVKLFKLVGNV